MKNLSYVISVNSEADAAALMGGIGVAEEGIALMAPEVSGLLVRLNGVDARQAAIIKQEMLYLGGDAALPGKLYDMRGRGDILLVGSATRLGGLAGRLELHHGDLPALGRSVAAALANYRRGREDGFPLPAPLGGRFAVMGVLNVTPDSFHDGGRHLEPEQAVRQARALVDAGADIIDVGGESTRPGSSAVSLQEELARIMPVVEALVADGGAVVSVDTSKAEVARQALAAGAGMVNDVTALTGDSKMAEVVAAAGCPVCLMHMRGKPATMQRNPSYSDVIGEVAAFLGERAAWAESRGIARESIIIDPGIGFGKQLEHNLQIINRLDSFLSLGLPVMIGASRKSFIGAVLGREATAERLAGTIATTVLARGKGAQLFRVHDVRENLDALRIAAAVKGADV